VDYYLYAFGNFGEGMSPASVRDTLLAHVQQDAVATAVSKGDGWASALLEDAERDARCDLESRSTSVTT
jgi:hypothetical protein